LQQPPLAPQSLTHLLSTQVGVPLDVSQTWPAPQAGEQVATHSPALQVCPDGHITPEQDATHVNVV